MIKAIQSILILLILIPIRSYSQDYEFSLNPRRMYDQIHVEFWAKKLNENAPIIGDADLYISHSNKLLYADFQSPNNTDSIHANPDRVNPIVGISTIINSLSGFSNISVVERDEYAGLRIRLINDGEGGANIRSTGKGSFIGKIIFDIASNPDDDNMDIEWGRDGTTGEISISDIDGVSVKDEISFVKPENQPIVGVKILSVLNDKNVIDFKKDYNSLGVLYKRRGFPIYFERSINPGLRASGLDINNAYLLEYSQDGDWEELGRIAENNLPATSMSSLYFSGQIARPPGSSARGITTYREQAISSNNYRSPLRVLWTGNNNYKFRSTNTKIRISILDELTDTLIRARASIGDESESIGEAPLGSMFFANFNGSTSHFRSEISFSTPTQFTVEAWINPSSLNGDEVGIVTSSAGPDGSPINGKKEGAWMLYLKDGKYPAFRIRELLNRGEDGYLADLVSEDEITSISYSDLNDNHSQNWIHLAGVVKDNVAKLYVDGELVDENNNISSGDIRVLQTDHYVYVGTNPNGGFTANNFFNGGIKEVKLWRIALEQEQIIRYAGGISAADSIVDINDFKTGLDIYYKLSGNSFDYASNPEFQDGSNDALFFESRNQLDDANYLPDLPHGKIVSPVNGTGLRVSPGVSYQIKYLTFGLGNNNLGLTEDIEIEYSIDGGANWIDIRNSNGVQMGGNTAPDAESGITEWTPYRNNDVEANLRIGDFDKKVKLRITGHEDWDQLNIRSSYKDLNVSPFFSLDKEKNSKIFIEDNSKFDINEKGLFIEAWIKPHRFPTDGEDLFPIFSRADSSTGSIDYSLGLNQYGQLEINYTDTSNKIQRLISNEEEKLKEPLSITKDTIWHHVAAYINPEDHNESFFLIDGFLQKVVSDQISDTVEINTSNNGDLFIGYLPQLPQLDNYKGYEGQIRELRIWDGIPFNYEKTDQGLDSLQNFIQGAMSLNVDQFLNKDTLNLITSFSFNGGLFSYDGKLKSIASSYDSTIVAKIHNAGVEYVPTEPYLRIVEPVLNQITNQDEKALRIRWVGFNYDETGFTSGRFGTPPSLEFSPNGGGGQDEIPYQHVGGSYWPGNTQNAFIIPDSSIYRFTLHGGLSYFAGSLNISLTDPDTDENTPVNRQGPFPIALTNARLRLTGIYTIESTENQLRSESELFSVFPGSNLTLRLLKEAYHQGNRSDINQIDTSFDNGGIKVELYFDDNGKPGDLASVANPVSGYDELSSINKNFGSNLFANLNYVVSDLPDGNYWLVAKSQNYLPVMSRFPIPFKFEGDDKSTWEIESGWDFVSWNGSENNILPSIDSIPLIGDNEYYTAFGEISNTFENQNNTSLIFNDGVFGGIENPLPALVAGDMNDDGIINNDDLQNAVENAGSIKYDDDVNGDMLCNAIERNIVRRNIGYLSSLDMLSIAKTKNKEKLNSDNSDKIMISSFRVSSAVERIGDNLILEFFISNIGDEVSISNASFAFNYDTTKIELEEFEGSSYYNSFSAPFDPNDNPGYLSIEIENSQEPLLIPNLRTSIGKFSFKIRSDASIVEFNWNNSSTAFDQDGLEILQTSILEDIKSYVSFTSSILYPSGGEIFGPGDSITVRWANEGSPIKIEYNEGDQWIELSDDSFDNNTNQFGWKLPFVTGDYRLRMLDSETSTIIDVTEVFSIQEKFGEIVSPNSNDEKYEGGNQATIFLIISGYNSYNIDFSSDNGQSWESQFKNLESDQSSISWEIPSITTNTALLRITDNNNNVIDVSEPFRIQTGFVQLRTPVSGETLNGGEESRIIWLYENVSEFDLEYSIDSGTNWTKIATVNSSQRFYDWQVVNQQTNNGLVRAVWNGIDEFEYDRTSIFSIQPNTNVENENFQRGKFKLLNKLPINDNAVVEVETLPGEFIAISIFSNLGQLHKTNYIKGNGAKVQTKFDLNELDNGLYFIVCNSNSEKESIKILINR